MATRREPDQSTISTMNITHLSDELLVAVSSYLPETSVALFASIFSTTSDTTTTPSTTSLAIVSSYTSNWEVIDFLDIDEELRMRLTDDDIGGLLFCIDAVHKVKRLNLTHCFQFTGKGLHHIRDSVVLEQIDLSLAGQNESLDEDIEIQISEEDTLPILLNLIGQADSSLKHLQFPQKWRDEKSDMFCRFLRNYNRVLNFRRSPCSYSQHNRGNLCRGNGICQNDLELGVEEMLFGIQKLTCLKCLDIACQQCSSENLQPSTCSGCKQTYCGYHGNGCQVIFHCEGSDSCQIKQCTTCCSMYRDNLDCYICDDCYGSHDDE